MRNDYWEKHESEISAKISELWAHAELPLLEYESSEILCKWLEENARDYAYATIRCPYGEEEEIICDVYREIVEDFRKAMEE